MVLIPGQRRAFVFELDLSIHLGPRHRVRAWQALHESEVDVAELLVSDALIPATRVAVQEVEEEAAPAPGEHPAPADPADICACATQFVSHDSADCLRPDPIRTVRRASSIGLQHLVKRLAAKLPRARGRAYAWARRARACNQEGSNRRVSAHCYKGRNGRRTAGSVTQRGPDRSVGTSEWTTHLSDRLRLDARIEYELGNPTRYAFQLSGFVDGEWVDLVRYDTAHGEPHRHIYYPGGNAEFMMFVAVLPVTIVGWVGMTL